MADKNCVLVFNLGSSDLPKDILKPEEFDQNLGRAEEYRFLNENFQKFKSRINFPIVEAYLERIGFNLTNTKDRPSNLKCVIFAIGTMQEIKSENSKSDTLELAKLLKEYLKGGAITVKIEVLVSNPSSYDIENLNFYHDLAIKVHTQAKMLNAEIYCGLTGGTPACNTMLVLQATKLLEDAIYLYAPRDGSSNQTKNAIRVPLSENLKHYELKHHLIELLENQDFTNAFKVAQKIFNDEKKVNCFKAVYLESIGHYDEIAKIDTSLDNIYHDRDRNPSQVFLRWYFLEHKFVSGSYSLFILFASDYWENIAMLLIEEHLKLTREDRKKLGANKDFLEYTTKFPYRFDSVNNYSPMLGPPHFNKIDILQLLLFLKSKGILVAEQILKAGDDLKSFFDIRNKIAHQQTMLNETDSKVEFERAYLILKNLTEKMLVELKLVKLEKSNEPMKNYFSEMATRLKNLVFSKN